MIMLCCLFYDFLIHDVMNQYNEINFHYDISCMLRVFEHFVDKSAMYTPENTVCENM